MCGLTFRKITKILAFLQLNVDYKLVIGLLAQEGVSKLSYSKKKSQSPDFHKPGLCYV